MCGIFGIISPSNINYKDLKILANHARQRGKDSSGYIEYSESCNQGPGYWPFYWVYPWYTPTYYT